MKTRGEVIAFCSTFKNAFEDYPFKDPNWTVMRHRENRKVLPGYLSGKAGYG